MWNRIHLALKSYKICTSKIALTEMYQCQHSNPRDPCRLVPLYGHITLPTTCSVSCGNYWILTAAISVHSLAYQHKSLGWAQLNSWLWISWTPLIKWYNYCRSWTSNATNTSSCDHGIASQQKYSNMAIITSQLWPQSPKSLTVSIMYKTP